MVRFSDMLGGSGEPEEERATDSPYAALASGDPDAEEPDLEVPEETAAESEPESFETPEAVLERLERYANSARVAEPVAERVPNEPVPPAPTEPPPPPPPGNAAPDDEHPDDDSQPPGDDFLPRPKAIIHRSGWGRKRRP